MKKKKDEILIGLEGVSLISVGLFAIFFDVLSLVPETQHVIFHQVTVFDVLQTILKIAVIALIYIYHENILHLLSEFYLQNYAAYPKTKSDLNFLINVVKFLLFICVYEMIFPQTRFLFEQSDAGKSLILPCLDVFLIVLGAIQIVFIWISFQKYLADIAKEADEFGTRDDIYSE